MAPDSLNSTFLSFPNSDCHPLQCSVSCMLALPVHSYQILGTRFKKVLVPGREESLIDVSEVDTNELFCFGFLFHNSKRKRAPELFLLTKSIKPC